MLTFMARILTDIAAASAAHKGANQLSRAVGIDEHTALLLDVATGSVAVVGVGTAYVCSADHQPTVCTNKTPLTFNGKFLFCFGKMFIFSFWHFCFKDISCVRLSAKSMDKYSFASWTGQGVSYVSDITEGAFISLPYGPVFTK